MRREASCFVDAKFVFLVGLMVHWGTPHTMALSRYIPTPWIIPWINIYLKKKRWGKHRCSYYTYSSLHNIYKFCSGDKHKWVEEDRATRWPPEKNKNKQRQITLLFVVTQIWYIAGWLVDMIWSHVRLSHWNFYFISSVERFFVTRCTAGRLSSSSHIAFTLSTHHPDNKYTQL